MSVERFNIHATAIVVGTTGLIFTGSSGSGKSELAFAFLVGARRRGLFHALVADDQIFVSNQNGRVLAERPDAIAGLMELRHSGLVSVKSIPAALMCYAVTPVADKTSERLPPEREVLTLPCELRLPLFRIPLGSHEPFEKFNALVGNLFQGDGT